MIIIDRRTASLLSLAQKAGKLASGEFSCENALRSGKAKLVIVCEDASDKTKKKFINKSFFYKVVCYVCFGKEELSRCIGKSNRAVVAVIDDGFAAAIKQGLNSLPMGDNCPNDNVMKGGQVNAEDEDTRIG